MAGDDEERRLRSVALQNVRSILAERQRVERDLFEERERLRITLASIGDAVISTDAVGRVVFLNRVAEMLTGWPQDEAVGRPMSEVFEIVNESTRQPVENPALRALRLGEVVELANHTVLISRDGAEYPIDDSAAPMLDEYGSAIGAVLVFRNVADRKRNEETRARLAAIVESSHDAILSKTLDGIIQSWNAGAEKLFGYTHNEAVGRPITMLIPPDRLDEETRILAQLRKGERIEHFETIRVRKDGRFVDISLSVSPVKDHEGLVIGASKIARDITDRKRADAALRESEGRHRFLGELSEATQPMTDPDLIMATAARRMAQYLGVDRCAYAEVEDEAIFVITGDYSETVPSIVGRWTVASFGAACARAMLANEPFVVDDVDHDARVGDDLTAYRQTNIQAVICVPLHKEGRFTAAMAVHQTAPRAWTSTEIQLVQTVVGRCWESIERARAARGLKDAAEQLALAFDAGQLGDWSWNASTGAMRFSPRALEIFGHPSPPDMTWAAMESHLHEDDRPHVRRQAEQAVATGEPFDVEYRVRRSDRDEVWVAAKGRAQYVNGIAIGMFGILQDITEKKRLEQELRDRATELASADRKKDDFIAMLAHELRNPLAPVLTGLEVMQLSNDPIVADKARATMHRQLSHMVRLIDDLLDVSRMSRNKLHLQRTEVRLSEIVSHAVDVAAPLIEAAGHRLHVSLPEEPVVLHADLTRLAQVFGNILTNSAKYTDGGGQIWLTAQVQQGHAVVSIRDTGIGIPADALTRIFDMFSQVDRRLERVTGGLGIGLALVKALVESHGGTVAAESAGPGTGSTFTVRLPVVATESAEAAAVAGGRVREASSRRRVLLADDNLDAAASMAELLELLGHEVHVAHDGIEAVETAERLRPDLVLMDIGMPRLDGLGATRRLRERPWGRNVTIIALTGWGQKGDRERTRAAGCNGHLVKPVGLAELEKLLANMPQGPVSTPAG